MASLFHVSEYHEKYPRISDTSCQYQKDKMTVHIYIKLRTVYHLMYEKMPVYNDLTKSQLLMKCFHGKTQNANEYFNGMIWNRVPKATHVGIHILSLGVYDAIAHFNFASKATLDVLKCQYTTRICDSINRERKRSSVGQIL